MSGASAVFILDCRGKVILWRNYRGEVPATVAERFVQNVVEESEESNVCVYVFVCLFLSI